MPKTYDRSGFEKCTNAKELTKEFTVAKNKLVEEYYSMTLIPNDQIVAIDEYVRLDTFSDDESCVYCKVFSDRTSNEQSPESICKGCPMSEAGNNCLTSDSTYEKFLVAKGKKTTRYNDAYKDALQELVDRYIDRLEVLKYFSQDIGVQ